MATPKIRAYIVGTTNEETVTIRKRLPDGTLDQTETTILRRPRNSGDLLARSDDQDDLTQLPANSYEVVEQPVSEVAAVAAVAAERPTTP